VPDCASKDYLFSVSSQDTHIQRIVGSTRNTCNGVKGPSTRNDFGRLNAPCYNSQTKFKILDAMMWYSVGLTHRLSAFKLRFRTLVPLPCSGDRTPWWSSSELGLTCPRVPTVQASVLQPSAWIWKKKQRCRLEALWEDGKAQQNKYVQTGISWNNNKTCFTFVHFLVSMGNFRLRNRKCQEIAKS
jgi:hypothetical protein